MNQLAQKGFDEKFCQECGAVIKAKAEICPKCGVRQMSPLSAMGSVTPNGKSKIAAGIFAILLGGFGIHKFFLAMSDWVFCICFFAGLLSRHLSVLSKA